METSIKLLLSISFVFQLTCVYNTKSIGKDEMLNVGVKFSGGPNHSSKPYPGYGTEWVYFPDGDGIPHFVNLTSTDQKQLRRGQYMEIEYRLYIRELSNYINLDGSAQPPNGTNMTGLLSNKPVKLVTHGWLSSTEGDMVKNIKDAYLKNKDVAVIAVDWSDTANDLIYPIVVQSTGKVGAHVGQFLDAFCELYNVSGKRLHLIGHSLGAHLMGVAASTTSVAVGRVTGLDPARPLFDNPKKPNTLTLDSSDAVFVDVIHTCGGALGVMNNSGHADFYPNSGKPPQPGCEISETCSHTRAYMYFSESIDNPTGFPACRSKNWIRDRGR
ncbi:pancreatic triacylglycerol lipase-like [Leguminivora glycinivorella]|uniref:pancreatic triacylglycerol lipase-like n=1 Tax=Leguminivora glycinivorella TaxID=1035111 RepID=UPI002010C743|nr:pancreatic triacylglycerol lipase-like [Leguminivora glycinivorella]